jgi:hypothetical protein
MNRNAINLFVLAVASTTMGGCIGMTPFPDSAHAGDTVAIAAGWRHYYTRNNVTVTITPSSGSAIVLPPNSPAVRAIVNLYPDPVSSLIVSTGSGQDLTPSARQFASQTNNFFTQGDNDWWETTVYLDLPGNLPMGATTIQISNPQGENSSTQLEIIPGTGQPNQFQTTVGGLSADQLHSLERVGHYTINFSGSTIPFAIQLDLTHNPDVDHGGSGRAYVVNTRGDLKNLAWKDDGTNLRLVLTPAKPAVPGKIKDFKCYVGGGIGGLQVSSVKAFDINGNLVSGVTASISTD